MSSIRSGRRWERHERAANDEDALTAYGAAPVADRGRTHVLRAQRPGDVVEACCAAERPHPLLPLRRNAGVGRERRQAAEVSATDRAGARRRLSLRPRGTDRCASGYG